uniref:Uncharacterized protein n=1 Tax=Anopheles epiroticus TaxID=199890 RepID=A0A182PFN9_9DIPT
DTVSPTDTACSSESPAFLGPSSSSHLLLYDQNSSEEELEVINGGSGCGIEEVGSVSGVPSRLSGAGRLPILLNPHHTDDDEEEEEEEDEDVDEDDVDDATEDIVEDDVDAEEHVSPGTTVAATIIENTAVGGHCGPGAMDTSSSNSSTPGSGSSTTTSSNNSIVRAREFMVIGGACEPTEPLDDFAEELSSLTAIPPVPAAATKLISAAGAATGKRLGSVSSLLEKRKRSLAHNSDDEVRYLLEQQQQQPSQQQQQQQSTHHPLSHQYHHHHHHSVRQQHHHHHHLQQHQQEEELQSEEGAPLSAPVNFRTSPPLEALKPHRGHILQRATTPLVLSEGCGGVAAGIIAPTAPNGLRPSSGSALLSASAGSSLTSLGTVGTGMSGFYGTGTGGSCNSNSSLVGGGGAVGGLRFGLGRRPIGCDSPLAA